MSEKISGGVVTASKKHKPSFKDLIAMRKEALKKKRLGRQERRALRARIARAMRQWGEENANRYSKKELQGAQLRLEARRSGSVGKRAMTRAERKDRARKWKALGCPR